MSAKRSMLARSGNVLINIPYYQNIEGAHRVHLQSLVAAGLNPVFTDHSLSVGELLERVRTLRPIAAIAYDERWPREVFEAAAPNLEVLVKYGTGVSEIDALASRAHGVAMTNTAGCNILTTAELTVWLLGAALRAVVDRHSDVVGGRWTQPLTDELAGKSVLVLGAGNLAMRIAANLLPLGAHVRVTSRRQQREHLLFAADAAALQALPSFSHAGAFVWTPWTEIGELLDSADIVISALPETSETIGLISEAFLDRLKPGVVLGNMGRGSIIDSERAVSARLNSAHIGSYFADVWKTEPLPADSPLRGCPNVVYSSHVGAATKQNLIRCATTAQRIIEAFHRGEPLPDERTWIVEPPTVTV